MIDENLAVPFETTVGRGREKRRPSTRRRAWRRPVGIKPGRNYLRAPPDQRTTPQLTECGRRRFICPNGFHRAMGLCFRAFDAVKLMTSGASPIAQMSGAVFSATPPRGTHSRQKSLNRFGASAV
jgi:hypothetical protein